MRTRQSFWRLLALAPIVALAAAGPAHATTPLGSVYIPVVQHIWLLEDLAPQSYGAEQATFLNPPGRVDARPVVDPECVRTRRYGLRVDYALSGLGNGGWIASWGNRTIAHFDASSYTKLILWAKGSAPNGFQIGLKDTAEREGKVETQPRVSLSPAEWRRVAVPLSEFVSASGPVNLNSIKNINIGLNASHGAGSICVDNISFGGPLDEVYQNDDGGKQFNWLEAPGTLSHTYSADCRRSADVGLHAVFNFSGNGHGGWGIHWDDAPFAHFSAAPFSALSMWVRGTAPQGFHIGLKDINGHEVKAEARDYVVVSPAEWRKISVPLSAFSGPQPQADPGFVENINIGFNASHGAGDMCVADIAFE